MKEALRVIAQMYNKRPAVYCIGVAALVLVIDYITGKSVQFPILYILPAAMAAWSNQNATAYALAILLPLARLAFYFPWHETQSLHMAAANSLIRILALIVYVYLFSRTSYQTSELKKEVTALEGILPICASCKRIRNEHGEYEPIETYVTRHSEASFSHGICPECSKKLYPELFEG
ncbi:MAG: hypothetical protein PHP23_10790 [Desulfobacterales bacterium]|nr:hypothetical protein [Desulfobacterales bacterium]MDD4072419.1 hypothetical protein [Desulfobacterales bacterium]MDD4393800.1 hypothetical protein [Desulfobacterales bacterium]